MYSHTHGLSCHITIIIGSISMPPNTIIIIIIHSQQQQQQQQIKSVQYNIEKLRCPLTLPVPLLIGMRKTYFWQIATATLIKSLYFKSNRELDVVKVWILMRAFNSINGNMCRQYLSGLFFQCDNYQFDVIEAAKCSGGERRERARAKASGRIKEKCQRDICYL